MLIDLFRSSNRSVILAWNAPDRQHRFVIFVVLKAEMKYWHEKALGRKH